MCYSRVEMFRPAQQDIRLNGAASGRYAALFPFVGSGPLGLLRPFQPHLGAAAQLTLHAHGAAMQGHNAGRQG